jgi:hypothetical protein
MVELRGPSACLWISSPRCSRTAPARKAAATRDSHTLVIASTGCRRFRSLSASCCLAFQAVCSTSSLPLPHFLTSSRTPHSRRPDHCRAAAVVTKGCRDALALEVGVPRGTSAQRHAAGRMLWREGWRLPLRLVAPGRCRARRHLPGAALPRGPGSMVLRPGSISVRLVRFGIVGGRKIRWNLPVRFRPTADVAVPTRDVAHVGVTSGFRLNAYRARSRRPSGPAAHDVCRHR